MLFVWCMLHDDVYWMLNSGCWMLLDARCWVLRDVDLMLNAMRFVLNKFDYANKDPEIVGETDPLLVGRAKDVIGE